MNKTKLTIKDSSLSFLIGFLLCQLSVVVATCITFVVYKIFNLNLENFSLFFNTALGYIVPSLAMYITMVATFLFFNNKKENQIFKKVKTKKILIYVCIAIISFLCLYPIITCIDSLLVKAGSKLNTLPYTLNTKSYLISILSLVIAPAICEELLFRGIIFQGLKKYGKSFAIIISSLMFSLYHMSISQTVYPILIGLLLGVIMFYEENIYYCIAIHLTNNFLSLTLSYFKISLIFKHWTYILLAIILAVIFISVVLYFAIKNNSKNEKQALTKVELIYLLVSLSIMIIFWIFSNFS